MVQGVKVFICTLLPGDTLTGYTEQGGQQVRGVRRSLCLWTLRHISESGLKNPHSLCIYGAKPTPTATTVFSTDVLRSLLCLGTQVSQQKAEQSPEFTPTVSHTLIKAHQSNSSEELTNTAQPTKSGHTRNKDQAFDTAGERFGS